MRTPRRYKRANLFLLRMWPEEAADGSGQFEWHGKVQRVANGESQEFSSWQSLTESLRSMLPDSKDSAPTRPVLESESIHP